MATPRRLPDPLWITAYSPCRETLGGVADTMEAPRIGDPMTHVGYPFLFFFPLPSSSVFLFVLINTNARLILLIRFRELPLTGARG